MKLYDIDAFWQGGGMMVPQWTLRERLASLWTKADIRTDCLINICAHKYRHKEM